MYLKILLWTCIAFVWKEKKSVPYYKPGWLQSHAEKVCFWGRGFRKDTFPPLSLAMSLKPLWLTYTLASPALVVPAPLPFLMCSAVPHQNHTLRTWSHRLAWSPGSGRSGSWFHILTLEGSAPCGLWCWMRARFATRVTSMQSLHGWLLIWSKGLTWLAGLVTSVTFIASVSPAWNSSHGQGSCSASPLGGSLMLD